MALSAKDRERIVEEEQLRFETRQTLAREHCAKCRPNRWLWWLAAAALAYVVFSFLVCGGKSCSMGGHHDGWMQSGKFCHHGEMMDSQAAPEPDQALPPKK